MKKLFAIICAIFMVISLSSCQVTTKNNSSSDDQVDLETNGESNTEHPGKELETESGQKKEARSDCDFRNAKWGDSKEDVKRYELEIEEFIDVNDSCFGGETTVSGYYAVTTFLFDDNKLYSGIYAFDLNYSNAGQYIPVYNVLKKALTEKYGNPTDDLIVPLADDSLIEIAGEAKSLEFGYVQYAAKWETSKSIIQLVMGAQNYNVMLGITYNDKNHTGTSSNGL